MLYEQTLAVRYGYSILGAEKATTQDGYLLDQDVRVVSVYVRVCVRGRA